MEEQDILKKVKGFREDALAGSANKYERMRKAEDFRIGQQWDPAVKAANEKRGKFCLTIPLVKPQIKQVVGTQIQNPKDFKVMNLKSGSSTVASILTALAKHAMDSEQAQFEKTLMFESGLTTGEGDLGFFIDKTTDPKHGNLIVEKLNEFEVLWDPNSKVYDPNSVRHGCKFVIWEPWIDKDRIHLEYPDKEKDLGGGEEGGVINTVGGFISWMVGSAWKAISDFAGRSTEDVETVSKYKYQVSHTWWVQPVKCLWWYDLRKSELDAIVLVPDAMVTFENSETGQEQQVKVTRKMIDNVRKLAEQNPEVFSVEETVYNVMNHTIRIENVFLENRVDELNFAQGGVTMFPICRYSAYFANGHRSGMSEDLIGTQEEINWAHSQTLNIIKQMANTGWIIGKDISDYKRWLEAHAGEDGIILEKDKAGGFLEKIEPTKFPTNFQIIEDSAKDNLRRIGNVQIEDIADDKKQLGWQSRQLKQQASLTGSASVFMNFDYTIAIAGNLLIEIIRNNGIYSEDEIREIVDEDGLIDRKLMGQARDSVIKQLKQSGFEMPEPPAPPETPEAQPEYLKEMQLFQQLSLKLDELARPIAEGMLLDEIRNMRKGRYNTKVTTSPQAPSFRIAKAAELFELNKVLLENQQAPISRRLLIEATDVSNKEEIIEEGEREQAQPAGAVK